MCTASGLRALSSDTKEVLGKFREDMVRVMDKQGAKLAEATDANKRPPVCSEVLVEFGLKMGALLSTMEKVLEGVDAGAAKHEVIEQAEKAAKAAASVPVPPEPLAN